jgi:salicylate hydroxylase
MAMEDGYILAESVARSPDRLTDALRDYERIRMPRTRRPQLGSRQRAKENHLASPVARLKRDLRMAYEYDVSQETDFSVKKPG